MLGKNQRADYDVLTDVITKSFCSAASHLEQKKFFLASLTFLLPFGLEKPKECLRREEKRPQNVSLELFSYFITLKSLINSHRIETLF